MPRSAYWNHNVHYQPVILNAVPPACHTALDVGCGDGLLAARLAERCAKVTGIDRDPQMIATARAHNPSGVTFVEADFLTHRFPEESFDLVCANTSLHHMDFTAALTTMARLLRPSARLAVIGLAADKSLADLLAAAPALPVDLFYRAIYRRGESGAPIMDPDHSWREVRAAAGTVLPGVRYRRHLLWRYSLLWTKPAQRRVPDGAGAGHGAGASCGASRSGIIREDIGLRERFVHYRPLNSPISPNPPR
jgi:SAM-dependent methyltransferase